MSMSNKNIIIGKHTVGAQNQPYIIAELSGNHNQSLARALELVEVAAKSGAHAIKLQTYTADTITMDHDSSDFVINDENSLWNGKSLYELYDEAHTPWDWHSPIMDRANELGLACFSSPFDESAVDFLESLNVPAYKIASSELVHIPLIKKVASTGKPIIISTGMGNLSEMNAAVNAAKSVGNDNIILLKCTSTYPALPIDSNLNTIRHLKELFNLQVGLSDHSMGVGVSVAAVALGATVIEKHFTLKRSDGGVDSAFSLEPDELRSLVIETERAWQSLGEIKYGPTKSELTSLRFRRSIYVTQDIMKGAALTPQNIKCIRPGFGLAPKHYEEVLTHRASQDIKRGTPLSWNVIDK